MMGEIGGAIGFVRPVKIPTEPGVIATPRPMNAAAGDEDQRAPGRGIPHAAVFLDTAASSGGDVLRMAFEMRPRAFIAGAHAHPRQEELFGVAAGRIRVRKGRRQWVAHAGEDIVIPRGAGHTWGNPFDKPAQVVIELRPALRSETYFETYFGLARDGHVNRRNGLPSLLQFALMLHEYRDEFAAPPPLGGPGRAIAAVLAPLARARGLRARYGTYEDPEGP